MTGYPWTRRNRLFALISLSILCLLAIPAIAESVPDSHPEQSPQLNQIQSPDFTAGIEKILTDGGQPVLQMSPPVDENDRGGSYTNSGEGVAYLGPNAFERAKLAMAREAIEASRAAGTLMGQMQGPQLPERPEDLEAIKMQALRLAQPEPLEDSQPAGVGNDIPSVQNPGISVPSAEELERTAREMERRLEARKGDQR